MTVVYASKNVCVLPKKNWQNFENAQTILAKHQYIIIKATKIAVTTLKFSSKDREEYSVHHVDLHTNLRSNIFGH